MKKTLFFSTLGIITSYMFQHFFPQHSDIIMRGLLYAIGLEILYNQTKIK